MGQPIASIKNPSCWVIEGIDRLGKSTLIEGLLDELGYYLVVHCEKPKKLKAYAEFGSANLLAYQCEMYAQMFGLFNSDTRIIFDRAHLGEMVYAPLYRKYSGEYVMELEKTADTSNARLILLTTSDFSFLEDDGLSIDFSKKEEEQAAFVKAFQVSNIKDKIIIDVSNGRGGFKSKELILAEALKKSLFLVSSDV